MRVHRAGRQTRLPASFAEVDSRTLIGCSQPRYDVAVFIGFISVSAIQAPLKGACFVW
jgi:hypothetical protein